MDEEKLSGVLEWPVLTKVKQVQAFLGFVNFYHRFIENFAKMSKPLSIRGPLTHDSGLPPVAFQHDFIMQTLVTKEWRNQNARTL